MICTIFIFQNVTGWSCCCPWCWTLTFNWTWRFKNTDNVNVLKAEGPHLNGINVTNCNGLFLLCPQGCPGWATAHFKERPIESGCHGESCKWPKKKEGKKGGISWKREPPEVALVSPGAGCLHGTDLSQVELFDVALKCKLFELPPCCVYIWWLKPRIQRGCVKWQWQICIDMQNCKLEI